MAILSLVIGTILLISSMGALGELVNEPDKDVMENSIDEKESKSISSSSIQDYGGPDSWGYEWINSTGSPSVPYNWVDGITNGTPTGLGNDDYTNAIDLGFNFTYYGEEYDQIYIMSNGWISFTDISTWYQSENFPNNTDYNCVISLYSENLDPSSSGEVYYKQIYGSTNQFVVTWDDVPHYGTSEYQTFEVVLNETGEIWFNYDNLMNPSGNVGIENQDSTIGLDYDSQASLNSGLSIKFQYDPPPYMVELSPEMQSNYSKTKTTVDYPITVSNQGTNNDTYTLSASNNTWPVTFRDINDTANITEISVNSQESKDFIARVSIPESASEGDHDIAKVTATSQGNASVSDNSETKTIYMTIPNNVAIFQSQDPWGITAIKDILNTYGIPYTVYGTNDIGVVNLSSYDKTIIVGGDGQDAEFYSAISEHKEWFEDYTADGGVLNIHVDDWGDFNDIPCGLSSNHDMGDIVDITYPDHPFLTLPNNISDSELDNWGSSYHRYFTDWPDYADVVLTEGDTGNQWPVLLDYPWAKGRVIATGQTVEWGWNRDYSKILENIILAMNGTASLPSYALDMDPEFQNDFGDPGTTADHEITINNMGAQNDTYTLSASNNTWPVTFRDIDDTTNISEISVNAGGSKDFIARVSIPESASEGIHDIVDINATSQGNSSRSKTVQIKTNVYAPILLVDDDAGLNTEDWFMDALDANGYDYNYFDRSQKSITTDELMGYNITLWCTGNTYGYEHETLSSSDRDALGAYLDNGGRLYLSSSLAGYDVEYYGGWTNWYNTYLHSSYESYHYDQPIDMAGAPGDPISDNLNITLYGGDYDSDLGSYSTGASPVNQGKVSYVNTTNSFNSAIRADTGTYKMVYTGFDFAGVKGQGNRTELMYRIIEWLNAEAVGNSPPNEPTNPSPSNESMGVATEVTLSVDVSDPDGDPLDVSFYNAYDNSLIGTDTRVKDGGTASVTWYGLEHQTTYSWYTVADDGPNTTRSNTWSFTTGSDNYKLIIDSLKGGNVTRPGEGVFSYDPGTTVQLEVVDDHGYQFREWTGDNNTIGDTTATQTNITMDSNKEITAVFEEVQMYELTVNVDGEGITNPAEGTHSYENDRMVTVEATPANGWEFDEWTGDASGSDRSISITMNNNKSITANFQELAEYELTIKIEGEGSTDPVVGNHTYYEGEEVSIEATPDEGWEFVEWAGDASGNETTVEITMDEDKEITAMFEEENGDANSGIPGFTTVVILIGMIFAVEIYQKRRKSGK